MPVEEIRKQISRLDWRSATSQLAALAMGQWSGRLSAADFQRGLTSASPLNAEAWWIKKWLSEDDDRFDGRLLIHEEAVSFLQSLFLAWADGEEITNEANLILLTMAISDHLDVWTRSNERKLSELEKMTASLCHIARLNWQKDIAALVCRTVDIFSTHPVQGKYSNPADWETFQRSAFGGQTFNEYAATVLMPLALYLFVFVAPSLQPTGPAQPIIDFNKLLENAVAPEALTAGMRALCADRDSFRREILKDLREDGLPRAPTWFQKTPLVALSERQALFLTPWLIQEKVRLGPWGAYRAAVGEFRDWSASFGNCFELWARRTIMEAAKAPTFRSRLRLSAQPGDPDEIEDITIEGKKCVALFSVKASIVPLEEARGRPSEEALLRWYERFLFAEKDPSNKDHKAAGTLRLLNAKIDLIRASKTPVSPGLTILPVVVSFDDLGDNLDLIRFGGPPRSVESG